MKSPRNSKTKVSKLNRSDSKINLIDSLSHRRLAVFSLAALLLLPMPLGAEGETRAARTAHTYQTVKIIDGDTFDATDGNIKFRVRIAGMDAPEKGSPFSKLATVELKNRIKGKKVEIQPIGPKTDRYNRVLGQVTVDGRDVGIEMIEKGLATYYRPGCVDYPANKKFYDYDPRRYIAAEERAQAKNLYLWSDPKTILPCRVRRDSGH